MSHLAGTAVLPRVDAYNVEHVALGLIAGTLALVLAGRTQLRPTYPLLATLAVVLVSPRLELTGPLAATAAVAGVATGWGALQVARTWPRPALALGAAITVIGMWLAVPDTEAVLVVAGVLAPAMVVALARRPPIGDLVGWPLLAATVMVVIASSSAEDPTVAISGYGCAGLLVVAPAVVAVAGRDRIRSVAHARWHPGTVVALAGTQAAIALGCSRVGPRLDGGLDALALVAVGWAAGAAMVWTVLSTGPEIGNDRGPTGPAR